MASGAKIIDLLDRLGVRSKNRPWKGHSSTAGASAARSISAQPSLAQRPVSQLLYASTNRSAAGRREGEDPALRVLGILGDSGQSASAGVRRPGICLDGVRAIRADAVVLGNRWQRPIFGARASCRCSAPVGPNTHAPIMKALNSQRRFIQVHRRPPGRTRYA